LGKATDKFGIEEIYETNPEGAEPFYMGFDNW
jgi:hypothetical protein